MAGKKWTNEENDILILNYEHLETNKLLELLKNRTYEACKIQANKLGLNRVVCSSRNHKLSKLLLGTNESYYWLGFIYADGSLNFKQNRVSIKIGKKDTDFLRRAATFFETDIREAKISIDITMADKRYFNEIVKTFNFKESKTFNPPDNLSFLKTKEQFISFLAGFIDGDGCIKTQTDRKDCVITIKIHSSWLSILQEIEHRLYEYLCISKSKDLSKINNAGYAFVCFSKREVLNSLKKEVLRLNLPIMDRKWSKINLNLEVERKSYVHLVNKVLELKNKLTVKQIAAELDIPTHVVYRTLSSRK